MAEVRRIAVVMADSSLSPPATLREVRCRFCGQLLFMQAAVGRIEIVCTRRDCRRYQVIMLTPPA